MSRPTPQGRLSARSRTRAGDRMRATPARAPPAGGLSRRPAPGTSTARPSRRRARRSRRSPPVRPGLRARPPGVPAHPRPASPRRRLPACRATGPRRRARRPRRRRWPPARPRPARPRPGCRRPGRRRCGSGRQRRARDRRARPRAWPTIVSWPATRGGRSTAADATARGRSCSVGSSAPLRLQPASGERDVAAAGPFKPGSPRSRAPRATASCSNGSAEKDRSPVQPPRRGRPSGG